MSHGSFGARAQAERMRLNDSRINRPDPGRRPEAGGIESTAQHHDRDRPAHRGLTPEFARRRDRHLRIAWLDLEA
jgi:hypothetical protein